MKRYIIILVLSGFINYSFAQSAVIDSLSRLISEAKTDTARINLTNQKIYRLSEINIDSSMSLAKKIIEDAKKINYKKGEAEALLNMATNFSRKGDYASARHSLEDAEVISKALNDSLLISRVYSGYGMMYGIQSKYDTSTTYYQKSIGINERLGNKKALGTGYGNIAIGYMMQSNFPQALIFKAIKLFFSASV